MLTKRQEKFLELLKSGSKKIGDAPKRWYKNRDFVLEAVKIYGGNYRWIEEEKLRNDREIILEAVKNGLKIKEVPNKCYTDREIMREALKGFGAFMVGDDDAITEIQFRDNLCFGGIVHFPSDEKRNLRVLFFYDRKERDGVFLGKGILEEVISEWPEFTLELVAKDAMILGVTELFTKHFRDEDFVEKLDESINIYLKSLLPKENLSNDEYEKVKDKIQDRIKKIEEYKTEIQLEIKKEDEKNNEQEQNQKKEELNSLIDSYASKENKRDGK